MLHQIAARGGGLEVSIAPPEPTSPPAPGQVRAPDLVWRVRLLGIHETQLLIEVPSAMGQALRFEDNTELAVVMAVGQNRWMFRTRVLPKAGPSPFGVSPGIRLAMPEGVQRCPRRDFLRVATTQLQLPEVECWHLLDPASVLPAEVANRAMILDLEASRTHVGDVPMYLPEIGPMFKARLMNIGGGGLGLHIDKSEASAVDRSRLLWIRLDLTPHIPAPLGMTARLAHTHLDSEQNIYAGVAFEFSFNPPHRQFVVDQITRYSNLVQKAANSRTSAAIAA